MDSKKIIVAGATGFVGSALVDRLYRNYSVIGLSRSPVEDSRCEWRSCDFFSLLDAEKALAGGSVGIYLVHSMLPSAQLTQGSFEDFDLIAADNFARAAKMHNFEHIIYLGGLFDESTTLSRHLESRREVESALRAYGTPVTTLRAGLIIGPGGSSFTMLRRLVERLPVMILPRWTSTETEPISLDDILILIVRCIESEEFRGGAYEVGCGEKLTYKEMLRRTAKYLGLRRFFIEVPVFSPHLSKLWVSLVTNAPGKLVKPLIESLTHRMVVNNRYLQEKLKLSSLSFEESIRRVLVTKASSPFRKMRTKAKSLKYVRSVQRLPLPKGMRAHDIVLEYYRWMPRKSFFIIRSNIQGNVCRFSFAFFNFSLLELTFDESRSSPDRSLVRITGGILVKQPEMQRGRLEFREVFGGKAVIAAIHDFRPSLPWYIYVSTQAIIHLRVMMKFRRHLRRLAKNSSV